LSRFRIYRSVTIEPIGAATGRPRGFVKQNRIAAGRSSIISHGNPNHCDAMVGQAGNARPYIRHRIVTDKPELSAHTRTRLCRMAQPGLSFAG